MAQEGGDFSSFQWPAPGQKAVATQFDLTYPYYTSQVHCVSCWTFFFFFFFAEFFGILMRIPLSQVPSMHLSAFSIGSLERELGRHAKL